MLMGSLVIGYEPHCNFMKLITNDCRVRNHYHNGEVDLNDENVQRAKCDFGARVTSLLDTLDAHTRRNVHKTLANVYVECSEHLIIKLPFDEQVIHDAKYIHPLSQKYLVHKEEYHV